VSSYLVLEDSVVADMHNCKSCCLGSFVSRTGKMGVDHPEVRMPQLSRLPSSMSSTVAPCQPRKATQILSKWALVTILVGKL
jgi:hypothetical protein